jgi:phage recombination protein Bet
VTGTEVATRANGALASQDEWSRDRIELIKRTYFKGASDDELALGIATCQRTGLSPEARQIYFIKRYDAAANAQVMQAQVSIDGFRLVAERSGRYAGQDGPYWCGKDGVWRDVWLDDTPPAAAKVVVFKQLGDGTLGSFTGTARWSSYVQTTKDGKPNRMWTQMPDNQLAKCAEALALRKAFPAELSGLYTTDEMGQAANDDTAVKPPAKASTSTKKAAPAKAVEQLARSSTRRPPPGVDPETGEVVADVDSREKPPPAPPDEDAPIPATGPQRAEIQRLVDAIPQDQRMTAQTAWTDAGLARFRDPAFPADQYAKAVAVLTPFVPNRQPEGGPFDD